VRKGIGSDARIGNKFIYPGVGYGGSCFPKDVKALIKTAKQHGYDMRVLSAVEDVNDDQKYVLVKKVNKHFNNNLKGKKFGVWGLSFKPKTDDMREAPSLVIIPELLKAGATVIAYDPVSMPEAEHTLKDTITYAQDPMEALEGVDALLIVTEWSEFRSPDFDVVKSKMKGKVIFDGRNVYDPKEMKALGFEYYCIGLRA
jgi:UDPglucose 6-dehydrogenase